MGSNIIRKSALAPTWMLGGKLKLGEPTVSVATTWPSNEKVTESALRKFDGFQLIQERIAAKKTQSIRVRAEADVQKCEKRAMNSVSFFRAFNKNKPWDDRQPIVFVETAEFTNSNPAANEAADLRTKCHACFVENYARDRTSGRAFANCYRGRAISLMPSPNCVVGGRNKFRGVADFIVDMRPLVW